jgi:uncharacterized membrane protein/dolichol kinase
MDLFFTLWPLAVLVLLTTLLTEWATRGGKFPYWIGRKVLHFVAVGSCGLAVQISEDPLGLFWVVLPVWLILIALIASNRLMKDERGRPAWGIVWFPLAYLILLWLDRENEGLSAANAMYILAICDPLATIIGRFARQHRYSLTGEPKSVAGNLAFFGSALILLPAIFGIPNDLFASNQQILLYFAAFALLLTLAEALGSYGTDNLLVPLAVTFLYDNLPVLGPMLIQLFLLLALGAAFTWYVVKTHKMTLGAAIGAVTLAVIVLLKSGGWLALLPLLYFFFSSILLERLLPSQSPSDAKDRKARDLMQVIANGGVFGLVYLLLPDIAPMIIGEVQTDKVAMDLYESQQPAVVLSRFLVGMGLVSLAVSTADTWASTIGRFARSTAFDPFRWQKVPAGLSGGMTWIGTLAGLAGSINIAAFLFLLLPDWKLLIPHLIMIAVAGFGGMLLDSLLGSWFQRQYYANDRWYDHPPAGSTVTQTRGISWMSNDLVNLLANLIVCAALGIIFLVR